MRGKVSDNHQALVCLINNEPKWHFRTDDDGWVIWIQSPPIVGRYLFCYKPGIFDHDIDTANYTSTDVELPSYVLGWQPLPNAIEPADG